MTVFASPRYLPTVLWLDAASCAATGALHLLAGPALASLFGLPPGLLAATGWVLLAVAAYAAWCARSLRRPAVWLLVAGNLAWVVGCVELLLTGAAATAAGVAWLVVQAVAVAALAELEFIGLRRARPAAWA